MTEEDRERVRRSIRGDREAFSGLYGGFWTTVLSFAASHVRDFEDARGIAQETFLQAWKGIGRLREPERFPGWIRSIAANEVRKWAELAETRAAARRAALDAVPDSADPRAEDPGEAASRREFEGCVREALDDLPPLAREATLLRLLAGLGHSEIAERLGLGLHQARGLVARGAAKAAVRLRRRFAPEGNP